MAGLRVGFVLFVVVLVAFVSAEKCKDKEKTIRRGGDYAKAEGKINGPNKTFVINCNVVNRVRFTEVCDQDSFPAIDIDDTLKRTVITRTGSKSGSASYKVEYWCQN